MIVQHRCFMLVSCHVLIHVRYFADICDGSELLAMSGVTGRLLSSGTALARSLLGTASKTPLQQTAAGFKVSFSPMKASLSSSLS